MPFWAHPDAKRVPGACSDDTKRDEGPKGPGRRRPRSPAENDIFKAGNKKMSATSGKKINV